MGEKWLNYLAKIVKEQQNGLKMQNRAMKAKKGEWQQTAKTGKHEWQVTKSVKMGKKKLLKSSRKGIQ